MNRVQRFKPSLIWSTGSRLRYAVRSVRNLFWSDWFFYTYLYVKLWIWDKNILSVWFNRLIRRIPVFLSVNWSERKLIVFRTDYSLSGPPSQKKNNFAPTKTSNAFTVIKWAFSSCHTRKSLNHCNKTCRDAGRENLYFLAHFGDLISCIFSIKCNLDML